jgi:hypothetical protein
MFRVALPVDYDISNGIKNLFAPVTLTNFCPNNLFLESGGDLRQVIRL